MSDQIVAFLHPRASILRTEERGVVFITYLFSQKIILKGSMTSSIITYYIEHVLGRRKEGNVLFNDALNTFHLQLYGVRHMVKDHSDGEKGNPLPHRLLFPISSKGSFICTIPQTG